MPVPLTHVVLGMLGVGVLGIGAVSYQQLSAPIEYKRQYATSTTTTQATDSQELASEPTWPEPLDRAGYDEELLQLASYEPPVTNVNATGTHATPTPVAATIPQPVYSSTTNVTVPGQDWPAAAPYPHGGAILPFHRVIAYYGNFYSTRMGILGEFSSSTVLARLASTSAAWEAADPDTPVMPAIHYIAMVAQADAGADGMYRNVMPDEHIERAYDMTQTIDGIMFIDLQVGLSTIERELPKFERFLTRPDVHLAIDPEFSMKDGTPPGLAIGTFTAADINYVIDYLSQLVREHELPPKILVVHRFTQNMVQDYQAIKPTPEVQVVIHMDGWGSRDLKRSTYRRVVEPEPVQFAGLKIFYKNDLKPPSTGLFSPTEALELHPEPIYIQYQ